MKIFYKFKKLQLPNKFTVRIPAGLFHFAYNMHRKNRITARFHCIYIHIQICIVDMCYFVCQPKLYIVQPYIFCIQLPMSTTQFTLSLSLPPFPQCEFKCYDGCEISRSTWVCVYVYGQECSRIIAFEL